MVSGAGVAGVAVSLLKILLAKVRAARIGDRLVLPRVVEGAERAEYCGWCPVAAVPACNEAMLASRSPCSSFEDILYRLECAGGNRLFVLPTDSANYQSNTKKTDHGTNLGRLPHSPTWTDGDDCEGTGMTVSYLAH